MDKKSTILHGNFETVMNILYNQAMEAENGFQEICGQYQLPDLSLEEQVRLYSELSSALEGDEIIRIIKGDIKKIDEYEDLRTGYIFSIQKEAKPKKKIVIRRGTNKLKIKIPGGYLVVEEKGTESDYPGVYIFFLKDGCKTKELVACVEYESCDGEIRIETYQKEQEEPNHIIRFNNGKNLM